MDGSNQSKAATTVAEITSSEADSTNQTASFRFFKGKAFSVDAPNFVVLEVTDTEPGFKGDTTSNTTKPATLETGYQIAVPLFINIGDKIRVDTRDGSYMSRA